MDHKGRKLYIFLWVEMLGEVGYENNSKKAKLFSLGWNGGQTKNRNKGSLLHFDTINK